MEARKLSSKYGNAKEAGKHKSKQDIARAIVYGSKKKAKKARKQLRQANKDANKFVGTNQRKIRKQQKIAKHVQHKC